ncbi:hypothetical protein J4468_01545 [Candidatus Woesearchaeota archaeon]|nr:hypothetical protein [Candidatus Woesearchaeota archaeon]
MAKNLGLFLAEDKLPEYRKYETRITLESCKSISLDLFLSEEEMTSLQNGFLGEVIYNITEEKIITCIFYPFGNPPNILFCGKGISDLIYLITLKDLNLGKDFRIYNERCSSDNIKTMLDRMGIKTGKIYILIEYIEIISKSINLSHRSICCSNYIGY